MIVYRYYILENHKIRFLIVLFMFFLRFMVHASTCEKEGYELGVDSLYEYSIEAKQKAKRFRQTDSIKYSVRDTSRIRFTDDTIFISLANAQSEQIKRFLNKLPYQYGLLLYEELKEISKERDSLFNRVESWVYPSFSSPFFTENEAGYFDLRSIDYKRKEKVNKGFYLMIKFILSLSQTRYCTGAGPTVMIYSDDTTFEDENGQSVNYSQLLGAITWYKLNMNYISDELFLLFMMSKTGTKYDLLINEFDFSVIVSLEFLYPLVIRDDDDDREIVFNPSRIPESEVSRLLKYEESSASNLILKQKGILPFFNLSIDSDKEYDEFLNYQESFTYPKYHILVGY